MYLAQKKELFNLFILLSFFLLSFQVSAQEMSREELLSNFYPQVDRSYHPFILRATESFLERGENSFFEIRNEIESLKRNVILNALELRSPRAEFELTSVRTNYLASLFESSATVVSFRAVDNRGERINGRMNIYCYSSDVNHYFLRSQQRISGTRVLCRPIASSEFRQSCVDLTIHSERVARGNFARFSESELREAMIGCKSDIRFR